MNYNYCLKCNSYDCTCKEEKQENPCLPLFLQKGRPFKVTCELCGGTGWKLDPFYIDEMMHCECGNTVC